MKAYLTQWIEETLLNNGIDVMIPENENSNYGFFFYENIMFYFQEDHFSEQIRFSSHHIPSRGNGSGFGIDQPYEGKHFSNINYENIKELPKKLRKTWGRELSKVKFYTSFEDFMNKETILKYKVLKSNKVNV